MSVRGFSHVTINVKSLAESLKFYVEILGMEIVHRGSNDAYIEWGQAWICLQEKPGYLERKETKLLGIDHLAFYVPMNNFENSVQLLKMNNITIIREPVKRGMGLSVNFLDPDGTHLELHTSTLAERMTVWGNR
jgi:catechol 2,3-dioxygenase-like lactoylglutathione lyase family enzyme